MFQVTILSSHPAWSYIGACCTVLPFGSFAWTYFGDYLPIALLSKTHALLVGHCALSSVSYACVNQPCINHPPHTNPHKGCLPEHSHARPRRCFVLERFPQSSQEGWVPGSASHEGFSLLIEYAAASLPAPLCGKESVLCRTSFLSRTSLLPRRLLRIALSAACISNPNPNRD